MLSASLDGAKEYLHMLTYVLDTDISPLTNIVKISINSFLVPIDGEKR